MQSRQFGPAATKIGLRRQPIGMELTADDDAALASLRHKQMHIEDAVTSLAKGHDTAVFLWGEGGTGKSYTCERRLTELGVPYVQHNSRMTGRGLVDALMAAPQVIHWIEDAETLLDDKKAIGVLRSACWSQSTAVPKVRNITWTAHRTQIRIKFTGGLLLVSNANLVDTTAELRALATRVKILRQDVSPAEVLALTKKICQDGYRVGPHSLTPAECWRVIQFAQHRLSELHRQIDLRLLLLCFADYVLAREASVHLEWEELVAARMQGTATQYKTPKQHRQEATALAKAIYAKRVPQTEKLREWFAKTGKTKASFYNAVNS